jgi:hypothetical protein
MLIASTTHKFHRVAIVYISVVEINAKWKGRREKKEKEKKASTTTTTTTTMRSMQY